MTAQNKVWKSRGLTLGLSLSLTLLVGCGGTSTGTLSGTVTFKGDNLKGGEVIVVAADGKALRGEIKADGTYSIPNVPVGAAKLGVDTSSAKPLKLPKGAKLPTKGPEGGGYDVGIVTTGDRYVAIPDRFKDVEKSGLTVQVTGGPQTHNIPLQ